MPFDREGRDGGTLRIVRRRKGRRETGTWVRALPGRRRRVFRRVEAMMATTNRMLIVDDDADLRASLAEQFALHEGFAVHQAADGKEALALLDKHQYEVILLDVGLPDTDGRDLCRLMRRHGIGTPVIILSGRASDADTVVGLDSGANDYVAKPVRFRVLLARVHAQCRQLELGDDATFAIGPYLFRPSSRMLVEKGSNRKLPLTDKETAILKYLCRAGNRPVARRVLLEDVWGYNSAVTTHTLETHIYRLRQKIEPDPGAARMLVTEAAGYRLAR